MSADPIAAAPLPMLVRGERAERFLFAPASAQAAAVFRVALAVMIAWGFESSRLGPALPLMAVPGIGGVYTHVWLAPWYYPIVVALCALLAVGWRPRLVCVVLLLMVLPLASLSRGQLSRQVLWFTLAAFAFVRSDAAWSVRSWLARRRGDTARPSDAGPMWPIRLIQLQLCLVYAVNALVKMHPDYLSGDVLIAMSHMRPNFNVDMTDGVVEMGPLHIPVMLAAIGTVITEAFLAVAFWFRRLRWAAAFIGVGFHVGLMIVVDIWMLDWVSMFLYSAFLLPWSAERSVAGADSAAA